MIKNVPRNYSNDLDRRRQGLDSIVENLLPDVETSDAGKIMKVGEDGKWHLGSDENTIIEANPEGTASEDLENLKIGSTIYAVNKPTFEVIKGIRVTIADGGQYRTDKPKIEFYDDAGNLMTYPAYTSSCDKEYAGNISLNQVCSIATGDAPGAFTYVFSDNVVVTTYHLIKLTNAGSFAGDIAKNVKIELSSDGENFITLWEDPSISWSGTSGASRILDIKTGELSDTILPIVTSADNGKVLGVVGGVWDKANPPTELPAVTSADNGKVLGVVSGVWNKMDVPSELPDAYNHIRIVNRETSISGAWSKDTSDPAEIVFTGTLNTTKFKAYGRKPYGDEVDITNDFGSNQALCKYPNTTIEFDFQLSELKIVVIPNSSMTQIRKGSLQLIGNYKYIGVMYDPVDKNYGIAGEVSIVFNSDYSTVTITVTK